jgi:hypothetical protein
MVPRTPRLSARREVGADRPRAAGICAEAAPRTARPTRRAWSCSHRRSTTEHNHAQSRSTSTCGAAGDSSEGRRGHSTVRVRKTRGQTRKKAAPQQAEPAGPEPAGAAEAPEQPTVPRPPEPAPTTPAAEEGVAPTGAEAAAAPPPEAAPEPPPASGATAETPTAGEAVAPTGAEAAAAPSPEAAPETAPASGLQPRHKAPEAAVQQRELLAQWSSSLLDNRLQELQEIHNRIRGPAIEGKSAHCC